MRPQFRKIVVIFEQRDDGGLRAYSDDVPGFILSHSNPLAVLDDVAPALGTILSAMFDAKVTVEPLTDVAGELEDAGIVPTLPNLRRVKREYVGQLAA